MRKAKHPIRMKLLQSFPWCRPIRYSTNDAAMQRVRPAISLSIVPLQVRDHINRERNKSEDRSGAARAQGCADDALHLYKRIRRGDD